jgi:hypothetical protein
VLSLNKLPKDNYYSGRETMSTTTRKISKSITEFTVIGKVVTIQRDIEFDEDEDEKENNDCIDGTYLTLEDQGHIRRLWCEDISLREATELVDKKRIQITYRVEKHWYGESNSPIGHSNIIIMEKQ